MSDDDHDILMHLLRGTRRRRRFTTLDQAFAALRVHDTADQAMVRDWVEGEFRTDDFWDQFFVDDPEGPPDPRWPWPADTMFSDPSCRASLWMPPSGGYVAVGGQVGNWELIAARIHRTRLVVINRGLKFRQDDRLWSERVMPFPSTDEQRPPRSHLAGPICASCGTQLPRTGRCDYCE